MFSECLMQEDCFWSVKPDWREGVQDRLPRLSLCHEGYLSLKAVGTLRLAGTLTSPLRNVPLLVVRVVTRAVCCVAILDSALI